MGDERSNIVSLQKGTHLGRGRSLVAKAHNWETNGGQMRRKSCQNQGQQRHGRQTGRKDCSETDSSSNRDLSIFHHYGVTSISLLGLLACVATCCFASFSEHVFAMASA